MFVEPADFYSPKQMRTTYTT